MTGRVWTRRGALGAMASAAVLLAVSGCHQPLGETTHRYKMTVEVDTPQGVRSGHAVREVTWFKTFQGGSGARVKGEAVAVDLPGGQTLFALLTGDGGPDYGPRIASWVLGGVKPGGENRDYKAGEFAELYPTRPQTILNMADALPVLVRFRDLNDPKSVERVLPDDLEARFGPGIKPKRITIEITDEDVTVGIGKRLRWLSKYPEPRLDFTYKGSSHPNLSQALSHGDFREGIE